MNKLILKNSEWQRGGGGDEYTFLLNNNGMRCCLGILARELGFADDELLIKSYPSCVGEDRRWPEQLRVSEYGPNAVETGIACTNDGADVTDEKRVAILERDFNRMGWTLEYRPNE